jgi:hypothetical protein
VRRAAAPNPNPNPNPIPCCLRGRRAAAPNPNPKPNPDPNPIPCCQRGRRAAAGRRAAHSRSTCPRTARPAASFPVRAGRRTPPPPQPIVVVVVISSISSIIVMMMIIMRIRTVKRAEGGCASASDWGMSSLSVTALHREAINQNAPRPGGLGPTVRADSQSRQSVQTVRAVS